MNTTDEQIKKYLQTLTRLRDDIGLTAAMFRSNGLGSEVADEKVDALQFAINSITELRESRELLEAATEIAFNGEKFMHKIYKAGGQWSDIRKDEWHDSALDAFAEVKKQGDADA